MTGGEDAQRETCKLADALKVSTGQMHSIPPMRTGRRCHDTASSATHLFVFGGVQETHDSALDECEMFNPETQT